MPAKAFPELATSGDRGHGPLLQEGPRPCVSEPLPLLR